MAHCENGRPDEKGSLRHSVVFALTVIVFVLDLTTPLVIAIWVLYILPLGLTPWSSFRPLTASVAGACNLALTDTQVDELLRVASKLMMK